ncbi:MAG: hypothetical protein WEA56_09935 [Balneolaceae bacterium]
MQTNLINIEPVARTAIGESSFFGQGIAFRSMLVILIIIPMFIAACSEPGNPTDSEYEEHEQPDEQPEPDPDPDPPEQPVPPPGNHLSVSPIPVETIVRITPIGSNNKIFPVAHTYWMTCDIDETLPSGRPCHLEQQQILAPGDGIVTNLNPEADGQISVEGPPGLFWTLGHVTPADFEIGDSVAAGQHIATMFYDKGFDLGMMNYGVEHDYISPERYPDPALYSQHPIAQFPEPLRSELLARVFTIDSDPFGRLSYDVPGTASGGWFIEGAPPGTLPLDVDNWHMLLFLGRYVERQATRIVTFGESWPEMPNFSLVLDEDEPDWEDITPSTGVIALKLWNMNREALPNLDWQGGTMLLEMPEPDRLRVEWFDTHDPVEEFTEKAKVFVR